MSTQVEDRQKKLERFFASVLRGKTDISSARTRDLFIEAVCAQEDVATLGDQLICQPKGLEALQRCFRQDLSVNFITGPASQLLARISEPSLAEIDSGRVLSQIIRALLQPSFFWSACIKHLKQKALNTDSTLRVAWLLHEILRLSNADEVVQYVEQAKDGEIINAILNSESHEVRSYGYQIKHQASLRSVGITPSSDAVGPGGRHDNDLAFIRDIRLMPTRDEIISIQPPFLRTAAEVFESSDVDERCRIYPDHMFRLLREDMVHDFKEKLLIARSDKRSQRSIMIPETELSGVQCDDIQRIKPWHRKPWAGCFRSPTPLPGFERMTEKARSDFLNQSHGQGGKMMRHGAVIAICARGELIGIGLVNRLVDRLSSNKAEVLLRFCDGSANTVLDLAASGAKFDLVQTDSPLFAYEPFLKKLQQMSTSPFSLLLLGTGQDLHVPQPNKRIRRLVEAIESNGGQDMQLLLKSNGSRQLDVSQRVAILSGLKDAVSLIQGPPGTGKSFVGALIARALHDHHEGTILVISYTNHALDQFVEDLMDIGIPGDSIVRFGSKSSVRTEPLLLRNQQRNSRLSQSDWTAINEAGNNMERLSSDMDGLFDKLFTSVSAREVFDFLEFSDNDDLFYDALRVPTESDGMTSIGKKGKAVEEGYLLKRWLAGHHDPGGFSHRTTPNVSQIWQMPRDLRRLKYASWQKSIRQQHVDDLKAAGSSYNQYQEITLSKFRAQSANTVAAKRIIACTSTYAAMLSEVLERVQPETVLLEEAGELLEPHVLTSISPRTQRLVMIGDHKQLRPKIAKHSLTVEKGDGYDLNRSLFERLILNGFRHVCLSKQHRMRPEIAGLVRHLTYPNLEDADSVSNRPPIRGLQQNVTFVDHRVSESLPEKFMERHVGASKQNSHEAALTLCYVKYLAQQGYGSDDMVVLTPYLGQLRLLQEKLSEENDPVLNDLDSHDLYQAGLLSPSPSVPRGRQIHISSIDNYQGEERKIVIVALTRSNTTGDIGFMSQPERLNVLLSRARDGLIVIGNLSTFTSSKKGGQVWASLRDYVKKQDFLCQGLPIQCQSHPDVKNIAVNPDDFQDLCPDGGCSRPCPEMLACGQHKCPSRCHILVNHAKIACTEIIKSRCVQGHAQTSRCQSKPASECATCKKLEDKRRRRAQARLDRTQKDEADLRRHDQEMDMLDEEVALIQQEMANTRLRDDRRRALADKQMDLQQARTQLHNFAPKVSNEPSRDRKPQSPKVASKSNASCTMGSPDGVAPCSNHVVSDERGTSPAEREWARQKTVESQSNGAIDTLMNLVGLEQVKQHVLDIKQQIDIQKRQGVDMALERFHVAFLGNPGTGKTTVARLWATLLHSLNVISGAAFEETTGSKLATSGVPQAQAHIQKLVEKDGGVMFVDEAYQLTNGTNAGGKQVLDFLLGEIENRRGAIVFVFAGYRQPMEAFFGHNPGIPSRVPHTFDFHDYSYAELLTMLQKLFEDRYIGKANVEGGLNGLNARIVARRLSRQRDTEAFGNMRDLENLFSRIRSRQARRIGEERKSGKRPDDYLFSREDLIGPEPSAAVLQSPAWAKLHSLTGLQKVKDSIRTLVSLLKTNYKRELQEQEPIQVALNKVFLGSPGTGKTSVAKLYGRLLADIGLLSNGDVVSKTPTDFIGSVLGASEQATSSILEAARGKVLIIDEAYMFSSSSGTEGSDGASDPFRTAVIDTIVSKVHNVPGDDCCVLLLGYEAQMEAMFQRVNPGFSRRFPLEDAFRFEDFSEEELKCILRLKLKDQDLTATPEGQAVALGLLARERNMMNFGNAGAVENLISKAKMNRQARMNSSDDDTFELGPGDFDPDYARAASAATRLAELFKNTVGFETLVAKLREYQIIAANVKAAGFHVEDHVPFNFVFKGPPGTGKTSTARKIGQVYYDMGLLQRVEVLECSASDLVGQYVGHTGPKTRRKLEKALGKVLFVDEAYRLGEGHFATEAIDELTDLLTKPQFKGKVVVVLAGYEHQMDRLISVNPGLASRFNETIMFESLTSTQCVDLLAKQLKQNGLECASLEARQSAEAREVSSIFERLAQLKSWGNARDVQNISKKAMRHVFGREHTSHDEDSSVMPRMVILDCLNEELHQRLRVESRAIRSNLSLENVLTPPPIQDLKSAPPPAPIASTVEVQEPTPKEPPDDSASSDSRDGGVSDAVWEHLQIDIAGAIQRQKDDAVAIEALNVKHADLEQALQHTDEELRKQEKAVSKDTAGGDDFDDSDSEDSEDEEAAETRRRRLRELEAARLQRQRMLQERERLEQERRREKARQEKEREQEAFAQKKLREMGVCCMGFRWIRQADGYRCAGGTHFVDNVRLGV